MESTDFYSFIHLPSGSTSEISIDYHKLQVLSL